MSTPKRRGKRNGEDLATQESQPPSAEVATADGGNSVLLASYFEGPLPHPKALQAYDQIIPGAAERILRMAEAEAEHRQEMEKRIVREYYSAQRIGTHWGAIVCLAALGSGTFLLYVDKPLTGMAAILFALVSPVVALATGKVLDPSKRKKDEPADDKP